MRLAKKIHVLLVGQDINEAKHLKGVLHSYHEQSFCVKWLLTFSEAVECFGKAEANEINVVIVDIHTLIKENNISVKEFLSSINSAVVVLIGEKKDQAYSRKICKRKSSIFLDKSCFDEKLFPQLLVYFVQSKANEFKIVSLQEIIFNTKKYTGVTLDNISDAVIATNRQGIITYLNAIAESITGWPEEDALGHEITEIFNIVNAITHLPSPSTVQLVINENRSVDLALNSVLIRRDGTECAIEDTALPVHDRHGHINGVVIIFHHASASQTVTQKMTHLAQHDFLTGLPNRLLMTERLIWIIGLALRHRKQAAILFLDVDYFKRINDSLGHAIGDELLKAIAVRLTTCVRTTDTICRIGGDEFVILLTEIKKINDASLTAEKLMSAFSVPFIIGGHELKVTLSIGLCVYPRDGQSAEILLNNADAAMYKAKSLGRNNFQIYKKEILDVADGRINRRLLNEKDKVGVKKCS